MHHLSLALEGRRDHYYYWTSKTNSAIVHHGYADADAAEGSLVASLQMWRQPDDPARSCKGAGLPLVIHRILLWYAWTKATADQLRHPIEESVANGVKGYGSHHGERPESQGKPEPNLTDQVAGVLYAATCRESACPFNLKHCIALCNAYYKHY